MPFEGRFHVFPQALIFGSRPLPVPGIGHVLCVSALLPFRLENGVPVKPSTYYEAVAVAGGKDAVPDTMAPLPGAEVLLLGSVPPVVGDERRAELRCGELHCQLLLRADPEAMEEPLHLGPDAGLWHETENPLGRGRPGDDRQPLILMTNQRERPIWLGPTSFLHPERTRRMGKSSKKDVGGWPEDAHPDVLYEAHSAFWTRSLHPGDPLRVIGLGPADVDLELPPYRPNLASSRAPDGRWVAESVRIHSVVLLPAAGLGALIWRSSIELGEDILGENVNALVFALEDVNAPERDEQDLAEIAANRWLDPVAALDDRPLLPAAMAAAAVPPKADPSAFHQQHAAAEEWARKEMGVGDVNPFAEPEEVKETREATDPDTLDQSADMGAVADIGKKVMAESKRRHEEAGFPEPDPASFRDPVVRGEDLESEIVERLARPFCSSQEEAIVENLAKAPPEACADPEKTLTRLADVRLFTMEPVLFWSAMTTAEGEQFGTRVLERFQVADPLQNIDISSAVIMAVPGDGPVRIEGRTFDRLLAEETTWRDIEFYDCIFQQCSFAKAKFEDCLFSNCSFERTNFSATTLSRLKFRDCSIADQTMHRTNWMDLAFEHCEMKSVSFVDWAIRDTVFRGGLWDQIQVNDALLVSVVFQDMAHREVAWTMTHAPYTRFVRVDFFKVWLASMGFPESEFESVTAQTCGFLGGAYFNGSRFANVRFTETGFTKATFNEARFAPDCVFARCDFSSASFAGAELANVRFLNCSMVSSVWSGEINASGAWFHGCILRGVDFMNTRLLDAVFTDADLDGTVLDDELTAGADFRGTVRSAFRPT